MDNKSKGMSTTTVLTLIFVVLKLCGVIKWSWIWVLAPTWISIVLCLIILIVFTTIKVTTSNNRIKHNNKRK